jgi:Sporulation protein and related proteins
MSQYGAYGYAQHGWTYPRILAHYYPRDDARQDIDTIRVLLADKQKTLRISSTVPFTLTDGSGRTHTLAAGSYGFGRG